MKVLMCFKLQKVRIIFLHNNQMFLGGNIQPDSCISIILKYKLSYNRIF